MRSDESVRDTNTLIGRVDVLHIVVVNSIVVIIAMIIHYESLFWLTALMQKIQIKHRLRVVVGVCGALTAHAIEVWIFALAYYFMHQGGWGSLEGNFDGSLAASGYFSFTTFITLGYGDIEPTGDLRYLTGIEALTGLVLIT